MRIVTPSEIVAVHTVSGLVLRPNPGTVPRFDTVKFGGDVGVLSINDVDLGEIDVLRHMIVAIEGGFVHAPVPIQVVQSAEPEMIPAFRPDRDPQGTPVAMIPSF